MATLTSAPPVAAADSETHTRLLQEIRMVWRQFIVAAFDPYRPELHYMRGPGPACAAKRPDASQVPSSS